MIWFGSIDSTTIFLKHSHLRTLLNLRELFTAGMAVHTCISSLFVLFARINGRPATIMTVWMSEKPLSLPENVTE